MKKTFIKYIISLFAIMFVFTTSCEWVDPEMNNDPNNSIDVSMDLLLAPSQAGMAYTLAGYGSYFSAWFTQQMSGGEGQAADYDKYQIQNTATNRIWRNSYRGYLYDLKIMMEKADEMEAPHYKGVGQVLTAVTLGYLTDMFGNIPWSDALEPTNIKPTYDTQEEIYAEIDRLLTEAVTNLSADAGLFPVGEDDLIYGGTAANWILAANSLRARYELHKSKMSGFNYQDVLDLLALGTFTSIDDDMDFTFGTAATSNAPLSQMQTDRINYMIMGEHYVDAMNVTNDPRLPMVAFETEAGGYAGGAPGAVDANASLAGGPYYAPETGDGTIHFISYAEVKFIEAECLLPTDPAAAATAYNDAVKASLAKLGVSDAAWEATYANEDATTIDLETIINGKYLALFCENEVWTDWRRTGFPTLTPTPNGVITQIPRRLPYPDDEQTYNTENVNAQGVPTTAALTKRLWWDVE